MKKATVLAEIETGICKEISVFLDDETANILENECDDTIKQAYVVAEYRSRLTDRKETRRHQSLDKSLEHGWDVADKRENVAEKVERREMKERLHKAIASLTDSQRELIYRVYYGDESLTDIAREKGVSKAAVGQQLKRAVNQLKKHLAEFI